MCNFTWVLGRNGGKGTNKLAKRRIVKNSDEENDNDTSGKCGGAFEDGFRGETWIQCLLIN